MKRSCNIFFVNNVYKDPVLFKFYYHIKFDRHILGFMRTSGGEGTAFLKTESTESWPDIQLMFASMSPSDATPFTEKYNFKPEVKGSFVNN